MATRSDLYAFFYSGDVVLKLATAHDLHARYGEFLVQQLDIMSQLTVVLADEQISQAQMITMGMGETCTQCANRQGGGCCSRFMAGENDVLQLLMNLLAGVQVVIQQEDTVECCFLGEAGCILTLKPMFCLNYNCSHIKEERDAAALSLLERRTGDLLRKQAVLEQMLLDFFYKYL